MAIQAHIFYSGTVQGVGFRYTVLGLARELDLCGWVKNLPDGRVEILTEGDEKTIRRLIEGIDAHFEGYIRGKDVEQRPAKGDFKDFRVTT